MDLSKILSISGKPGLYQMVSSSKNGLVVSSLIDGKKFTAFNHFNISSLEEINVYTESGEVSLKDILKRIAEAQDFKEALSHKSSANELTSFFTEVVPDYDKENVYTSDIKKIIQWYNLLAKNEMLVFDDETTKEGEGEKEVVSGKDNSSKKEKAPSKTKKEKK